MARFSTVVFMLFAMLYSAMAFPHQFNSTVFAAPYSLNVTSRHTANHAANATDIPVKRNLRNFPIALRAPGRA
ncbi:hypothetical protein TruAng_007010 [Truncatella angustata]|nr:hypothetical protein TruAng_007010 [Truncatella angustata]